MPKKVYKEVFLRTSARGKEASVLFAQDGIWLKQKQKRDTVFDLLSARVIKDMEIIREPEPFQDHVMLRLTFTRGPEMTGTPGELAGQMTHIHKDKLAQAFQIEADRTPNPTIRPQYRGFYIIDNQIKFFGERKEVNETELAGEKDFVLNLIKMYRNPAKIAAIFAWFVSAMLTPVRKYFVREPFGLLIRGEKRSGKTTFLDVLSRGLLGNYLESGQSIATPARFAKLANSDHIVVAVDEAEKFFRKMEHDTGAVEVFKNVHTTNPVARSILSKDRQQIVEYARCNFAYIINPLTFSVDEATAARLITITFDRADHVPPENRKPIPRPSLLNLFSHLVQVIEENSHEVIEAIKTEKTQENFMDTGLIILNLAGLTEIAKFAEQYLAGNEIELTQDDIFDEETKAVAEITEKIADIIARAARESDIRGFLEKMTIRGLILDKHDRLCLTKNFVAICKNKIKLTRLAEKLQEMGYHAYYGKIRIQDRTVWAVAVPLQEIIGQDVGILIRPEEDIFAQKIM